MAPDNISGVKKAANVYSMNLNPSESASRRRIAGDQSLVKQKIIELPRKYCCKKRWQWESPFSAKMPGPCIPTSNKR